MNSMYLFRIKDFKSFIALLMFFLVGCSKQHLLICLMFVGYWAVCC